VFPPDALPSPMAYPTHLQAIDRWRREARSAVTHQLAHAPDGGAAIRYAGPADAAAALELLLGGLPPDDDRYVAAEALFHDRLHDPDRPVLVAERDGALGGVALISMHQTLRGWHATLDDLVVAPVLRRGGTGRALVDAAAALARARGAKALQVALPVEQDVVRAFLVACGFRAGEALALRFDA
jgi:GNAT superfamily N-acetyltransferase